MVTRAKAKFKEMLASRPTQARSRSLSLTDAVIAVEWLNADRGTVERDRVSRMRSELEYLGKMLDSLHEGNGTPNKDKLNEFRARHYVLNLDLSRYAFCPVMAWDLSSGMWRYNTVSKDTPGRVVQVSDGNITVEVDEATAVMALVRLAVDRELHKVRLCEWCKKNWRVSERQIDRFCSPQCRTAWYQAQPEFKDRRKAIQKNYRKRENSKRAKALANAQALLKGTK